MKVNRIDDAQDHVTALGASEGSRIVGPGSILIVVRGMILAKEFPVAIVKREVTFNQDLKAVECNECVRPDFMYYWLTSNAYEIKGIADEAAHGTKRIQTDRLLNLTIHVPELGVQRRIASILSAYDDLIENNSRRIAILEEMAQAIYREWFVHFRFPGHEQARFVDSPLGRIPEGWKLNDLGYFVNKGVVNLQTGPFGTQLKASDYTDSGTPLINVRNIGYGAVRRDSIEHVPEEIVVRLAAHILHEGDIVFGRKGAVDRHALISRNEDSWMQGSDCLRLRSLSPEVSPYLLSHAFREKRHQEWMFNQCSHGATMPSLNQDVICRIPCLIPTPLLRDSFSEMASLIARRVAILRMHSEKLKQSRDLLLPKLISGQLDVEALDIETGELALEAEA
jgi:type I restriction enzyme S subunit